MESSPGWNWQEITPHTMTLRGLDSGASIILVADSILPGAAAIGLDISISIPEGKLLEPIQFRRRCGMYSSFHAFRMQLAALRDGQNTQPHLSLVGLDVVLYQHRLGIRTGLCVEGTASSIDDQRAQPWPEREHEIGDRLLLDGPTAYCLRFAFKTSLVDPPYIDSFAHEIGELLSHIGAHDG
jgi:hypothetical protein